LEPFLIHFFTEKQAKAGKQFLFRMKPFSCVKGEKGAGDEMKVRLLARALTLRWIAVSLASVCLIGASGSAAILTFDANLDGLQETPPNASPAFGFAELTLDDSSGLVTITTGNYQDLLGPSTAVHIHGLAGPGVSAPVIIALTLDQPGATTGTFSGSGTLTVAQIAGMEAGNTYVNVHSSVFPGGEIRGQLFQVPEPSSILLACAGLAGLTLVSRRKK
jgi:hypothetical protein